MKYFSAIILLLLLKPAYCQENGTVTIDLSQKKWHIENSIGKNIVSLSQLPESVNILFPDNNFSAYKIQINPDTSKQKFWMGLGCNNDSCIKIMLADFTGNMITLRFTGDYLVGIGNRLLAKSKKIILEKGKLFIKIIPPAENMPSRGNEENNNQEPSICDKTPEGTQEKLETDIIKKMYHFLCRKDTLIEKQRGCAVEVPCPFNLIFLPPCLDNTGNAITHKYRLVYDASARGSAGNAEPFTLLKVKRGRNKENGFWTNIGKKKTFEYYKVKDVIRPKARREMIFTIIGEKDTGYVVSMNSSQNFMEHENDFAKSLDAINPTKTTDTVSHLDSIQGTPPDFKAMAIVLKQKMEDLKTDLHTFNNVLFPTIDFSQEMYNSELLCLQKNIARIFEISIPKTGDQLSKSLEDKVVPLGSRYFTVFCILIKEIEALYEEAISKKIRYYIVSEPLRVPNEDELTIHVKTTSGIEVLRERKFDISGGFKIDFSSGFFHSGLSATEFVVGTQLFRYKQTRDSILPSGQDSTIYTGTVGDTSITVIRQNRKLSFGTGFYVHFYPRIGGAVNLGGSAGIILDNNGQVQFLLGGSLMFNVGKNRIAIVGGYARGREKVLSTENEQYYWNGKDTYLDSRNDLPKNFTATNPATYDKWKSSWFVGLTFNFASFTVGKKE